MILYREGEYKQCETLNREALATSKKIRREEHPGSLSVANNRACALHAQGKWGEAEVVYRRVLGIREQTHSLEHVGAIRCVCNLAYLMENLERYPEAAGFMRGLRMGLSRP